MEGKFKYFVKYTTNNGDIKVKILMSNDPHRIKLFEIRAVDPEADELIKCRVYDRGNKELDKEETIW
jgi:hypothetical protein